MDSDSMIVYTNIMPPGLKPQTLRRSSLNRKMKPIVHLPLMIMHAGAGYGKSTALASFVQSEKTPSFWYRLEAGDDDLSSFLVHLLVSIRNRFPGFGEAILRALHAGEQDVQRLCRLFIREIVRQPEHMMMVLDDYHHARHAERINEWLQYLLEHRPDQLHLIVSGRCRPAWKLLAKLKAMGELIEVGENDLAFSEEEIDVLFADIYDRPLHSQQVSAVRQMTEGWIMIIQWMRHEMDVASGHSVMLPKHGWDAFFPYLTMEVLDKQPEAVRHFMIQTSIFTDFSPPLCAAVLEMEDAQHLIGHICSERLFICPFGTDRYRYHTLFRDFLLSELRQSVALFQGLHMRAAQYYLRTGDYPSAMHHLSVIEDYGGLAEVVRAHGEQLIEEGQLDALQQALDRIPDSFKNRNYRLWIYEGDLYRYRCSYEKAAACYDKGGSLAKAADDPLDWMRALEGQAGIYHDTLQPGKAEALLGQALTLHKHCSGIASSSHYQLYYLMAETSLNSARVAEAADWYEQLHAWHADDSLKVRFHLRTGQLQQARDLLLRRKSGLAKKGGLESEAHRFTDHYLSLVEAFTGRQDQASTYAEMGIAQGVASEAVFEEALGWMRKGHAEQLLPRHDFNAVHLCYMSALAIMDAIRLPRGRAEPMMGLCLLYGRSQLWEQAIECGEAGLAETEKVNDKWVSTLLLLSMGAASVSCGRYAEANGYLLRSAADFEGCGDRYGSTVALMWLTLLAYRMGDEERLGGFLADFLERMKNGNYDFLLERRTMFGPSDVRQLHPLLLAALHRNIEMSFVKEWMRKLGMEHADDHPGYTLTIQTLGSFNVWLGDKEVEERDWVRGKVKELFQLLIVHRNRLITREYIGETLWKSASENVFQRDFKVALCLLNSLLEPGRKGRSMPFYLLRNGNSFGLNVSPGLVLDVLEYERLVKEGLEEKETPEAKRKLLQGLRVYRGDFLPERIGDDWCTGERERLKALFLRGAQRLAEWHWQNREYEAAIGWCEQMLEKDVCWEEAYRMLMRCHLAGNHRSQALVWYRKCVHALDSGLGLKPSSDTDDIYRMITELDDTQ
ncbi:transcriptional regulator [Paenibacillus sp. MZ04-78.2]|uniref:BTAD domain-containing putative transcriptional regulator n=1 Tax=Paenibacillus sp. MZ04-78.2 TaxID=2962034 RepID=UPI0020B789B6|nr:BTAD domain-containing putative transcriptional regulator [Paenibacillus sp. MZ04-78.2]MCP3775761.1 transcriptional regulator [Paenibacillus sp. MZ04-78.2]